MNTRQFRQGNGIAFIVAGISLLALLAACVALYKIQTTTSYSDENYIRLSRTNAKLNFCIDNGVSPCRYETILEWNSKHSADERFNVQPND